MGEYENTGMRECELLGCGSPLCTAVLSRESFSARKSHELLKLEKEQK
jgi:hypothetical protein